jgi:hypothetical protein
MQENNAMPDQLILFRRIRYSIFLGTLQKPKYRERYRNFFNSLIGFSKPGAWHPVPPATIGALRAPVFSRLWR